MTVSPERPRLMIRALNKAFHRRFVRWGLGAFVLSHTLLLIVLLLTQQFRWLPTPWPPAVTRVLFYLFFVTSVIHTMLFGLSNIGLAFYLYRRRGTDPRADPMTILRRAFVVPATYLLSTVWGWSWLTHRSPRLVGAEFAALWVGSQIAHFAYFTARGFSQARAMCGNSAQTTGQGRCLTHALQVFLATRVRKTGIALRRRWWLLTHRRYVEKMPPPDRALFQSVVRGVTQNVEVLLRRGANPNLRLLFDASLINVCISLGRTEAVRLLLDAGAAIAVNPSTGLTALHIAADKGNVPLTHLLLERGAGLEARAKSGATPLLLAARKGHTEIIRLLLESGAESNAPSRQGQTPLMSAAFYGHVEVVAVLLTGGADKITKEL